MQFTAAQAQNEICVRFYLNFAKNHNSDEFVIICQSIFYIRRKKALQNAGLILAGVVGIEPTSKVLETPILPLNHTPVWCANRDSNPGPTGYEPVALTN